MNAAQTLRRWLIAVLAVAGLQHAYAAVADEPPKFTVRQDCSECHSPKTTRRDEPPVLTTFTESPIWEKADKHRCAYTALTSERALEIKKDAWKDNRCLACHALDLTEKTTDESFGDPSKNRESWERSVAKDLKDGVSCQACHGPASKWLERHRHAAQWRDSPADRYDRFGMINLRDPVARLKICLSCHVGDIASGRFVTHDMYAAGHPPLPAFEIAIFMDQMPAHWRTDGEHSLESRRPQGVALEGLASLRASLQMVAHSGPYAGDFALYDCAACHHELERATLKRSPTRQQRGYGGGAPGRPAPRYLDSPFLLTEDRPQFVESVRRSLDEFSIAGPFGGGSGSPNFLDHDMLSIDKAIAALNAPAANSQQAGQMFYELCMIGADTPLTYEQAWQLTGAISFLASEMKKSGGARTVDDRKLKELSDAMQIPETPSPDRTMNCKEYTTFFQGGPSFDSKDFRNKLRKLAAQPAGK